MTYIVKKYQSGLQAEWDDLIKRSSNGTFLHQRAYMDYHADRFDDFSLMIYDGLKLKAVLPAHRVGNKLFAHKGLTYSDFIFVEPTRIAYQIGIIKAALKFLLTKGFKKLEINTIPFFFQKYPSESTSYIYFQLSSKIIQLKPYFVLTSDNFKLNKDRKKNLKRLEKVNFSINNDFDYLEYFWQIVEKNLKFKFNTKPVHTFDEIKLLQHNFPEQIKLFTIHDKNVVLAGALVYLLDRVFHFQYIHADPDTDKSVVDMLIFNLIESHKNQYKYFSFGSSEQENNSLNSSLAYWKESFGCKIFNQIQHNINLESYKLIKDILQ